MIRSVGAIAVTLLLAVHPLEGQGPSSPAPTKFPFAPGVELGAAINFPDRNLKVEGTLFLPEKTKRVRAVIVVLRFGPTEDMLLYGLNVFSPWYRLAEAAGSALLHFRVSAVRPAPNQRDPARDAALGGGEALTVLLRSLASESGHAELAEAPLLFWGWSAAAGFGPSFARIYPERTLAFIRYHSRLLKVPLDLNTANVIPALLFAGEKDAPANNGLPSVVEDSRALLISGRTLDAPWAFVLQPGVPHEMRMDDITKANELMIDWVTAVVTKRLPDSGTRLRAIPPDTGWLGNNRTGEISPFGTYPSSKQDASWLPDEKSARAWQALLGVK